MVLDGGNSILCCISNRMWYNLRQCKQKGVKTHAQRVVIKTRTETEEENGRIYERWPARRKNRAVYQGIPQR